MLSLGMGTEMCAFDIAVVLNLIIGSFFKPRALNYFAVYEGIAK